MCSQITECYKQQASFRSSRPEVFCKKGALRNYTNSQENTCARISFLIKETLGLVFSCEYWEISKNTFSYRTHPVAAPETSRLFHW